MALFEVTPYDRRIYEEELKDFLPQKILDVHTHVWLDKYLDHKPLAPGEVKRTVTWPSLVALDNSIEDLQETYRLMLPGKDVTALMFTAAARGTKTTPTWPSAPAGPASPRSTTAVRSRRRKSWSRRSARAGSWGSSPI